MLTQHVRALLASASFVVGEKQAEEWFASWMVAIAIQESGWQGQGCIGTANLIGYHWIPGCSWSSDGSILARESGTGRSQAYRKFLTVEDCFRSLLYLIQKSSHYLVARMQYERTSMSGSGNRARAEFVRGFSKTYSGDNSHGRYVYSILLTIERDLFDVATKTDLGKKV